MRFCDFIANISRLKQDIVDRKTALQTAITPVYAYAKFVERSTLVHKRRKIVLIWFSLGHKWQK